MNEQRYPLTWPSYVPRTKYRDAARFTTKRKGENAWGHDAKSMTAALEALQSEMDKLSGASGMLLSTNIVQRLDGLPRAGQAKPQDPGAALYFTRNKQRLCMPCDKWNRVEDNIYAIAKHIEAMRGMERWGVGTVEQAFAGYKALSAGEHWTDVLGVRAGVSAEVVQSVYRTESMNIHKNGGSEDAQKRLNMARDQALIDLGVKEP
jgi:hypothetical protein